LSLNFLWKEEAPKVKGILAIMDCDLFFTNPISFEKLMDGVDMAFCPIFTEGKVFPWTGLMLFDMSKIKYEDITFSFYALDGKFYSDVGSGIYAYIEKHRPKIRYIDRKEILKEDWWVRDGETLHTLGFPHPYSVDIIRVAEYPFLFHYKTSSNYAPHCTPEYNERKTKAINKLLA